MAVRPSEGVNPFQEGDGRPSQEGAGRPGEGNERGVEHDPEPKIMRRPHEPTKADRESHEELHEPYREWCRACVAGRGRTEYHVTRNRKEDAFHTVAIDYGYLSNRPEESTTGDRELDVEGRKCNPVLCGYCSVRETDVLLAR